jgi:Reverse transcriptase (RNA-dependent DNA polymerase).
MFLKVLKKWEYNKRVCLLFVYSEKVYDFIKRESLYDILTKSGASKKFIRIIEKYLGRTQSKVIIRNYSPSSFPIENNLKQGDALSSLRFNCALEYSIRLVHETNLGLDINGTHNVLAYADVNSQ